tara:strand:- start:1014 stop:1259 length:246 start_codon:yes stop_codon:yes gene_type:complete
MLDIPLEEEEEESLFEEIYDKLSEYFIYIGAGIAGILFILMIYLLVRFFWSSSDTSNFKLYEFPIPPPPPPPPIDFVFKGK